MTSAFPPGNYKAYVYGYNGSAITSPAVSDNDGYSKPDTGNFKYPTLTADFEVVKANQTITFGALTGKTYGDPDFDVSATASSGLTVSFAASGACTVSGATVHITGAGSCTITAKQGGNDNYNPATDVPQTFSIAKANATISVTPYNFTYDGDPHTATGTAAGMGGADLTASLNLSGTTHTNAGTYASDAWTFTDVTGNYNNTSGTTSDSIAKINATISVNGYTGSYDGLLHGATGSATGVGGANLNAQLNLGATFMNGPGGTAHWTFTGGTNYNNDSGDVAIVINKINATITVTPYDGLYDGAARGATGTATGLSGANLNSLLHVATTTYTNVPGGPVAWTFDGDSN